MTWLRVDDQALTHPRVLHLRSLRDPIATAEAVLGWVMLAASWSGAQNSDGFIAEGAGLFASPEHWPHLADFALKVGLVTRAPLAVRKGYGGQRGWIVRMGEGEVFHLLTRAEIELRKQKRDVTRRVPEKIEMLLRDGDQCRYCLDPVNEYDRKSGKRREAEHPDPNDPDVMVVACWTCNSEKHGRSVEEWVADGGRPLQPPPAERGDPVFLRPRTREWLAKHNALVDADGPPPTSQVARTGSQPDAAATPAAADQARPTSPSSHDAASPDPTTGSDPPSTPCGVAGQGMPGRVGTGRVGSTSGDPPRTRTRTRGSRGSRRRPPPPAEPDERSA